MNVRSLNKIPMLVCFGLILLSLMDELVDGLRYVKYAIPLLCTTVYLGTLKLQIQRARILAPFLFYISISTLYFIVLYVSNLSSTISDTVFVLTYVAPFLLLPANISPTRAFTLITAVFFLLIISKLGSAIEFDFANSTSSFESSEFGFIFGLFCIYFLKSKNKAGLITALILTVLALKRIAILGVLVAFIVYYFKNRLPERSSLIPLGFVAANMCVLMAIQFITSDQFNSLSMDLFGKSSNQLTMGRVTLYSQALDSAKIHWLYGEGPGEVYKYASSAFASSHKVLIHSDVLKILIEYGLLAFAVFIYLLYRISASGLEYICYLNILMLTDNPIVYSTVMFVFFMLLIHESQQKNAKSYLSS